MNRYHGDWNLIDNLHYFGYAGNKLGRVEDWSSTNSTVIGFQDKNNGTGFDYTYDVNGNMISDYNKSITAITYNFLNLPTLVTITAKGTIAYTYDAAGNKLQKTTTDQTVTPNKVTNYFYAGDFVYRNDTLEFISHPEGRLRPMRIDTTQAISIANLKYIYDYFLKDHLGSVRSVISTEQQTSIYAATMETANATKENQLFSNISSTAVAKPGGFDTDNANGQVSQLHGNTTVSTNKRVGPSIVLKVMAGDTISISTYAWYTGAVQGPASETGITAIANDILPLLTGGVVANNGTHGGAIQQTSINGWLSTVLNNFISGPQNTAYSSTKPKAFLNWMIVDEEFNAASSTNHLGAVQVPLITGTTQKQQLVGPSNMVVRRNGWLYVYVSNEADQIVYFDDLVINHKRGPLTEQKDYYAFGLEIPGLSTQAFKQNYNTNRYEYSGKELQSKEFLDGTGLQWEDYGARMYDPQIGRWHRIDPLADISRRWSPYNYAYNNPIRFVDPDGMSATESLSVWNDRKESEDKSNRGTSEDFQNKIAQIKTNDKGKNNGPGPEDPKKKSTEVAAKNVKTSSAGSIMKKALALGGTIALGGGAGFDLPADGVAVVVIVVGAAAATADLIWNLFADLKLTPPAYPGNDPTIAPLPGWIWRGKPGSIPGSSEGNWVNPNNKKEYLHPDLDHPDPIGPHWDWKAPDGKEYRYYPDGKLEPKE